VANIRGTSIIINITLTIIDFLGERQHLEETISTLRFATRVLCVQTNPRTNIQYDPVALLKKQETEIAKLKQELAMHDTLVNRKNISYEPYTEAQKVELRRQIKSYLDDEIEELDVWFHLKLHYYVGIQTLF
jgi:kinesin family protein 6/9